MNTVRIDDVLPITYCGLDPLFNSCPKMYIFDVLNMPEVDSSKGIFRYRGHLLATVDIVGVIVKVDVREKMIIYAAVCQGSYSNATNFRPSKYRVMLSHIGLVSTNSHQDVTVDSHGMISVDDSTGVISCSCWRAPYGDPQLESVSCLSASLQDSVLQSKLTQLVSRQRLVNEGYQLGILLHVRGNISVYNNVREIKAFHCAAVNNPNAETDRMLELPTLYVKYYNQPVSLPARLAFEVGVHGSAVEPVNGEAELRRGLAEAILHNIDRNKLQVVTVELLSNDSQAATLASKSQDVKIWQRALTEIEVKGHLCRHAINAAEYRVIDNDRELRTSVLRIIRSSSLHEKGDNGCHFLHIFAEIRKLASFHCISKAALQHCLTTLERQSDVAAVSDKHYVAVA